MQTEKLVHHKCIICGRRFLGLVGAEDVCWRVTCQRRHKREKAGGAIEPQSDDGDRFSSLKRTVQITLTLNVSNLLKARARRKGLSVSAFIRAWAEEEAADENKFFTARAKRITGKIR